MFGIKKKYIRMSTSRTGFKFEKIPINNETISMHFPGPEDHLQKYIDSLIKLYSKNNLSVEYNKTIFHKKPFWNFWGLNDGIFVVFDLKTGNFEMPKRSKTFKKDINVYPKNYKVEGYNIVNIKD